MIILFLEVLLISTMNLLKCFDKYFILLLTYYFIITLLNIIDISNKVIKTLLKGLN